MATYKGQSALRNANNCQGQLQTPQSVSVPATTVSLTRSSQAKFCPRQSVAFPAETSEIMKGILNPYLAKPRQNSKANLKKNELYIDGHIQSDTKKRELLKNPTKIEEIQEKKY